MRFIRPFLIFIGLLAALAAFLAAVAFAPVVQTWFVERTLNRQPGLKASIGSVTAGFSDVVIENLRLERDGVVLTAPAIKVELPVKTALWEHMVLVQSLRARGWTLDLTGRPGGAAPANRSSAPPSANERGTTPAQALVTAAAAPDVIAVLRGVLRGAEFPCEVALAGVDVEGVVLTASAPGGSTARAHVTIKGGGIAAGREGEFEFRAAGSVASAKFPPTTVTIDGRLTARLGASRKFTHVGFKGAVNAMAGALPDDLILAASVTTEEQAGAERFTLEFSRAGHRLAGFSARWAEASRRIEGTWELDFRDADVAPFRPVLALPVMATTGRGEFDADAAFARVHVSGRLKAAAGRSGILAALPAGQEVTTLEAGFDVVREALTLHVERFEVSAISARPIATAHAIQPFRVNLKTREITPADAAAGWLEGSLQSVPVAWFSGAIDGLALAGGDVIGDFSVQAGTSGFVVRSTAPLVAKSVTLHRAGQLLAQNIDLTAVLHAESTNEGWQFQLAPLAFESAGRRLGAFDGRVTSPPGAGRRLTIAGTWSADLAAMAAQKAMTGFSPIPGLAASGDIAASVGQSTELKGKINVTGELPEQSLNANLSAWIDASGVVSFQGPITVAVAATTSDFSVEGTWRREKSGPRLNVDLNAVNIALDHLGALVAAWSIAHGATWPQLLLPVDAGANAPPENRDRQPFWGDWSGRVKVGVYQVRADDFDLHEVAGTLVVERDSLRLEGGRASLALPGPAPKTDTSRRTGGKPEPTRSIITAEGAVAFAAAAETPYTGKAGFTVDVIDSAQVFATAAAEREPVLEGRFALTGAITASGNTLPDLIERRRDEYKLTGNGGILRLLKVNVAEAIPDAPPPTPAGDALAGVGTVLSTLMGIKGGFTSGVNKLNKETEAVLNFSYLVPEFRYDQMTLTAIRETNGTITLPELVITGTNERLTGSGWIAPDPAQPLRSRPLALDLRLGTRGNIAMLLGFAGLLSGQKDDQGYALLNQPIKFGGTLEKIDGAQWRDVLVKAALPKPARGK